MNGSNQWHFQQSVDDIVQDKEVNQNCFAKGSNLRQIGGSPSKILS